MTYAGYQGRCLHREPTSKPLRMWDQRDLEAAAYWPVGDDDVRRQERLESNIGLPVSMLCAWDWRKPWSKGLMGDQKTAPQAGIRA